MKTGIGKSKFCVPQPFSRCFISLCSSLFDFNLFSNNKVSSAFAEETSHLLRVRFGGKGVRDGHKM